MEDMEKEIKLYEEEYQAISLNIVNLKSRLDGKNITEEKYKELEIKLKELKNSLNEKTHEIGSKQERLNNIRQSLDKVKDISKAYEEADKKMDLLNELDKVTQGNKFVEYVATNQLKYIAIEASKRLKNITKGRYALELDGSGNFIMRDDFNGGVRRSVDTLSGGETFLTSLSLALALSSQIQLKGSAPLEFFFLDEGFGTLDSDLLEIVMQSLERLHSDKLSVGIISHVEELKNRVPVKLIVTSSEGGYGSKVKIEYS
jgi:DNA repair protein SbcC/Rad50